MSNNSVFRLRLKVLRTSADRQLYVSEFHTEGAPTLKAFADNVSVVLGTVWQSEEHQHHHKAASSVSTQYFTLLATFLQQNVIQLS